MSLNTETQTERVLAYLSISPKNQKWKVFYNHSIIIRNRDVDNETLNPFKVELDSIPYLYLNTLIFNKDQYVSGAGGNRRHSSSGSEVYVGAHAVDVILYHIKDTLNDRIRLQRDLVSHTVHLTFLASTWIISLKMVQGQTN